VKSPYRAAERGRLHGNVESAGSSLQNGRILRRVNTDEKGKKERDAEESEREINIQERPL
jgi:hypothetical protein